MALIPIPAPGAAAAPTLRKIAIEEHFQDPAFTTTDYAAVAKLGGVEVGFMEATMRRARDFNSSRIEEMDEAGIDISVLSLTAGGIEMMRDHGTAVSGARRINDFLAERVREGGGRFQGFASVALQDTDAAITELERAVNDLGMVGVMVNGYIEIGDDPQPHYLDDARFDAFWEALAELNVPLYLHPKPSVPAVRDAWFRGREELAGATWGFAPETATHTLRLVYGGVFDRHPAAQLILGHMGETLPFFQWRIQRAFEYNPYNARPTKRLQDYLSDNIHVTTSGHFNSQALITSLLTMGSDRILFASDYPYDIATDAARWIESAPISESDRRKIAYGNAEELLGLGDKKDA
ncbi:amidohydrolase family protein [Streptomyces sp. B21-083]|uniref:amidohydrolase family protein n=1 Tax=Streptomyces sp. B21-083 TaxID=3039410 RepID=UPI002FF1D467